MYKRQFLVCLGLVIAGASIVLVFAPKPSSQAADSQSSAPTSNPAEEMTEAGDDASEPDQTAVPEAPVSETPPPETGEEP